MLELLNFRNKCAKIKSKILIQELLFCSKHVFSMITNFNFIKQTEKRKPTKTAY